MVKEEAKKTKNGLVGEKSARGRKGLGRIASGLINRFCNSQTMHTAIVSDIFHAMWVKG